MFSIVGYTSNKFDQIANRTASVHKLKDDLLRTSQELNKTKGVHLQYVFERSADWFGDISLQFFAALYGAESGKNDLFCIILFLS